MQFCPEWENTIFFLILTSLTQYVICSIRVDRILWLLFTNVKTLLHPLQIKPCPKPHTLTHRSAVHPLVYIIMFLYVNV